MRGEIGRRFPLAVLGAAMLIFSGCASVPADSPSSSIEGTDKPYVVTTMPSGGEYNVPRFSRIEIRFSHLMDSGRMPGFEMYGGGMTIPGQLRWIDPMTLAFRPDEPLKAGYTYQCFLKDGRSKAGEELMGVPYIWVFTAGD